MDGRDTLDVFDFGTLFQSLVRTMKTGTLRVANAETEKYLCFNCGKIEAVFTSQSRFLLGHILVRLRALDPADLVLVLEQLLEELDLLAQAMERPELDHQRLERACRAALAQDPDIAEGLEATGLPAFEALRHHPLLGRGRRVAHRQHETAGPQEDECGDDGAETTLGSSWRPAHFRGGGA